MSIGRRKISRICQTFLISTAILFSLSGCDTAKLDTIDSDRDTVVSYAMEKDYGYAVGLTHIYILYGKYMKVPAGVAIAYKDKSMHSFRIRDIITKYPILDNAQTQKSAAEQEKKLKLI